MELVTFAVNAEVRLYEAKSQLPERIIEQLAKIGFEEDYSLTKSGETLEGLIDKFYIAYPESTETDEGRI